VSGLSAAAGAVAFGLDVGTSSAKGLALDGAGTVLACAEASYRLSTPRPGWSEQDPAEWWRASSKVLERLARAAGRPAGLGLSGQMHGLVALDGRDRPLRPAILWNDQRTSEECRALEARIGLERLVSLTGNRALPGFTAPKLLWLRAHEPDVYERIARICLPKDYVRLRLCAEHVTDVADASGTLLLDVARRRFSEEMLRELELERAWLPALSESPEPAGETAPGGPLGGGVVVAAGAGDQAAGALGVGVLSPGVASVVLGTSGVVLCALHRYEAEPQGRVHAFCHAVPGRWQAMGVMLSAAGSLRWLRDALGARAGYERLLSEAERWAPGVEGLTFLPYLAGERTPHADPDARGAFVGLSHRHDRGALVRAVLEGVAFGLRDGLELVAGLAGRPASGRVSGGGARSPLWTAILASVLELPLERPAVQEGAAFGAALLGGVAAGIWRDPAEAVAATVRVRETVEPLASWLEPYRRGHERFRALYPAIQTVQAGV
jgi:xylulokinase